MPAIFDSLVQQQGLEPHKAWRVAYVVPFIIIVSVALGMALTCDDTPSGSWSERHSIVKQAQLQGNNGVADNYGGLFEPPTETSSVTAFTPSLSEKEVKTKQQPIDPEAQHGEIDISEAKAEVVVAPTFKETVRIFFSKESMTLASLYACSFGTVFQNKSPIPFLYL